MTRTITRSRALPALAVSLIGALALTACGAQGEPHPGDTEADVTIVVHDSFVDGTEFAKAASEATGYDVEVMTAGDGGELTNKLVLTKGAPIADAFFGVDNTFASRLVDNEVVEDIDVELPERAEELAVGPLVPIDLGATCVNIDTEWFEENGIAEPETFQDLADEQYRDLTVLLDPTASSTGASFMIATIAAFGEDGFVDYWKSLEENGARTVQGWSDAYYGEFTGGGDTGTRPIVVSYSTSPAFTVNEDETESTTRALLDTCSTQIEFAGVLKGSDNVEGATAVVEYLLSGEFQSAIADEMYMYPVDESIELPASWDSFAPLPSDEQVHDLPVEEIGAGLEGWLRSLGEAVGL